jgi:hypothetical protein
VQVSKTLAKHTLGTRHAQRNEQHSTSPASVTAKSEKQAYTYSIHVQHGAQPCIVTCERHLTALLAVTAAAAHCQGSPGLHVITLRVLFLHTG